MQTLTHIYQLINNMELTGMKYKKSLLFVCLIICLFSIAGVCASDVNDTAVASQENAAIESADESMITVEDIEPSLSTAENGEMLSDGNDEIVGVENDLNELRANPGTYSELSTEIGSGGNVVLTHDYYTYDNGTTITISTSNSVIDGNGAIIDMNGSNILAFKVTGSGVTIKNLTIKNANVTEDNDGAAIYFEKAGTIENCNFINNYAGDAGAVYFNKANSKVINCNFTGNKAAFSGGAVCFKESGTVENCNFDNNTCIDPFLGSGGAICFNGTGNAINCNFVNNAAKGVFSWAGAISFIKNGNAINCTFTNNKANSAGGAVEISGNVKLENCSFDKNSAKDGGAVEVTGAASIINCNFTDNKVLNEIQGYGGAVYWNTSAGNIKNCIFDKNSAFRGGAVYFEKDGEVTDCKFNDNLAGDGGAVWFTEKGTVENSIFVKNEAWNEYGGGICFYTTGKIRNCSFTDSKADKQGGAVYWNGAGTVENCNFTNNTAQDAGAIFFSEDSTVENCIFVKNSATDQRPDRYFGGAIVFYKNGEVTDSSFTENTATEGGAILFKGNGKAINCDFTSNSAKFGGAIDFESRATVENCNFNGNIASSNGSAIWVNRAGGAVSSSVFVNNRANSGVIFFMNNDSASDLTINDNIFLNNKGVAIYFAKNDSVSNADYNWFGNNATNCDIEPVNTNVKIGTWLFLNATANPDSIHLLGSSDIIFKLYAYTPSEVSEYDNSRLNPVSLTLTPTNGRVNATKTDLGKSVQYTPEGTGIDKLTATIENAAHTITLKITDGTTFYDLNHVINGNNNDTIVLDSDYTYNSTFDYNLNGGIVIDRAVTIIGNGHILDAAGLARIFNIQADNVVINNITFTNGKTNIEGGAICWSGANGNLSGCSFVNNSVNYNGGAIYWNGAAGGLVSDCSFVNNSGYNGGALFLDASAGAIVSDCTFANNSANYGGAIFCDSGVGDVVSGCSFVNNTAGVGGAIYWWSSNEGLVYDCSFVNNSVRYYAAAIYWRGNDGNVSGCSFVNNSKYSIYFYNDENISHNLSINDNIFLNNTGVAIYFVNNDSSSNADYNWFGNNATNYDMAPETNNVDINTWLFLNGTANPDAIPIFDSSEIMFKLYAYAPSGVSEFDNSLLKAFNLTLTPTNGNVNITEVGLDEPVRFNPEDYGICKLTAKIENVEYTTTLEIADGTTFCDLNKTINGNDNDTIVLDRDYTYNSIFDYNLNEGIVINRPLRIVGNGHTLNATGLARIFSIQASNVVIENITFVNGKTDRHGGAIFWSGNNANISDCIFVNNSADQQGAAINLDGDDSVVSNCIFVNNNAYSGGAVYWSGDNGNFSGCSFVNNSASLDGGAITFISYKGSVSGCSFVNNSARLDGGAIYLDESDEGIVSNCSFVNNYADNQGGAISLMYTKDGIVSDCIFVNNSASDDGGAVYWSGDNGNVSGSIFVNNSANYGIVYFDNSFYGHLSVNDNIFLNNDGVAIYFVDSDSTSNADYNWFGNNATNYDVAPTTTNVELGAWLFLNATAYPASISVSESSDILFKLYSYNTTGISDYDNSKLPAVNLTLTANNGGLNESSIALGDSVEYTYNGGGDASVTATIENAEYTIVLDIAKADSILAADDLVMAYKDGSKWNVTLTDNNGVAISGRVVKFGIKDKIYSIVTDENGVAGLPINLIPDTYDINATFEGDGDYEASFVNATVTVNKVISTLTAEDITMTYKNGSWIVTLTGAEGVIPKAAIKFGILGKVYTIKTDENGVAALAINLAPGTYAINATFAGNKYYSEAFVNATVTVEKAVATLTASDLVMSYKDGSAYSVNVVDANGAAVVNAVVKFTIGSSNYNVKTDASGVAKLPINMYIGNYTVTATLNDANYESEAVSNTITVKDYDAELVASDVNMTYKDGTAYEVQLTDGEGNNIAVANLVVKITIKGSTYKVKTDANGVAKLPINLYVGTYDISAEYNGKIVNNTIIINKV